MLNFVMFSIFGTTQWKSEFEVGDLVTIRVFHRMQQLGKDYFGSLVCGTYVFVEKC